MQLNDKSKKAKRALIALPLLLLSLQTYAVDSNTANSNLAANPATPGSMFLLETGFWDSQGAPSAGKWVNTTRQCPVGFTAVINMATNKFVSTGAGQNAAGTNVGSTALVCPVNNRFDGSNFQNYGSGYSVKINYSTYYSSSSFTGNVGAQWWIYCYPSNMVSQIPVNDTTCSVPSVAAVPYLLMEGTVASLAANTASPSSPSGGPYYFLWPEGQCQAGWTPVASIWPLVSQNNTNPTTPTNSIVLGVLGTCNAFSGVARTAIKFWDAVILNGNYIYGGVTTVGYSVTCYPPGYAIPAAPYPTGYPATQWINATNGIVSPTGPPC